MLNATAPGRATRSFSHRNFESTHHHPHPTATTADPTATDELGMLRCLLNASVKQAGETGRHISQRLHAFELVNDSPLAGDRRIERIDHAVALVGEQWLNALTFAHALTQHLRRGLSTKENEASALKIWQESVFLADAAELLCRVTMNGASHLGWLCGLLLGAAEMQRRLSRSPWLIAGGTRGGPTVRRRSSLMIELADLIAALEVREELGLPASSDKRQGPWCALSAAVELAPVDSIPYWMHAAVGAIQPLDWPGALSGVLAQRIAELEPKSVAFASRMWIHGAEN